MKEYRNVEFNRILARGVHSCYELSERIDELIAIIEDDICRLDEYRDQLRLVHPETYVENINYNGKLITVASLFLTTQDTTYISTTIIDGNNSGSVVLFESEEDSTAVLHGFTLMQGSGYGPDPGGRQQPLA